MMADAIILGFIIDTFHSNSNFVMLTILENLEYSIFNFECIFFRSSWRFQLVEFNIGVVIQISSILSYLFLQSAKLTLKTLSYYLANNFHNPL